MDAIGNTTDSVELGLLTQAVAALAPGAEQARTVLDRILRPPTKPTPWQRQYLVEAVQALAPQLTAEQAQAMLGRVLDAIGKTTDADWLETTVPAVPALNARLTAEQTPAALGRVLDAL